MSPPVSHLYSTAVSKSWPVLSRWCQAQWCQMKLFTPLGLTTIVYSLTTYGKWKGKCFITIKIKRCSLYPLPVFSGSLVALPCLGSHLESDRLERDLTAATVTVYHDMEVTVSGKAIFCSNSVWVSEYGPASLLPFKAHHQGTACVLVRLDLGMENASGTVEGYPFQLLSFMQNNLLSDFQISRRDILRRVGDTDQPVCKEEMQTSRAVRCETGFSNFHPQRLPKSKGGVSVRMFRSSQITENPAEARLHADKFINRQSRAQQAAGPPCEEGPPSVSWHFPVQSSPVYQFVSR